MKKKFFIVIFAVSVILNIFSMVNYKTRKEQVLGATYQNLKNISQVLGFIKSEIESDNSGAIDYNNRELEFYCRELGIRIEELRYGISPIYDYDEYICSVSSIYLQFGSAIYEKDINAITFYITTINELIENLADQEESGSVSNDDFPQSMDYSLPLREIMNQFELFDKKISDYQYSAKFVHSLLDEVHFTDCSIEVYNSEGEMISYLTDEQINEFVTVLENAKIGGSVGKSSEAMTEGIGKKYKVILQNGKQLDIVPYGDMLIIDQCGYDCDSQTLEQLEELLEENL